MTSKVQFITVTLLFTLTFCSTVVSAAEHEWIKPGEEKILIKGGGFFPSFNTDLTIDSNTGPGTSIDLEDDLNLSETTATYYGEITWRFAKKHRLGLMYMNFDRDASGALGRDLEIEGEIYNVGAGFDSEFNFSTIPLTYSYSFINNERHELAVTLGVHWYRLEFNFDAYASVVNRTRTGGWNETVDALMPLIGLDYNFHVNDRWSIGLFAKGFALSLDDDDFSFDGSILNLGVNTEYWFFNNVALGVAVNYFRFDLDVDDGRWNGDLNYEFLGPQAYLAVRF